MFRQQARTIAAPPRQSRADVHEPVSLGGCASAAHSPPHTVPIDSVRRALLERKMRALQSAGSALVCQLSCAHQFPVALISPKRRPLYETAGVSVWRPSLASEWAHHAAPFTRHQLERNRPLASGTAAPLEGVMLSLECDPRLASVAPPSSPLGPPPSRSLRPTSFWQIGRKVHTLGACLVALFCWLFSVCGRRLCAATGKLQTANCTLYTTNCNRWQPVEDCGRLWKTVEDCVRPHAIVGRAERPQTVSRRQSARTQRECAQTDKQTNKWQQLKGHFSRQLATVSGCSFR